MQDGCPSPVEAMSPIYNRNIRIIHESNVSRAAWLSINRTTLTGVYAVSSFIQCQANAPGIMPQAAHDPLSQQDMPAPPINMQHMATQHTHTPTVQLARKGSGGRELHACIMQPCVVMRER